MQAGAGEADEGAEFGGGPLRGGGEAVDALAVAGALLEGGELGGVGIRRGCFVRGGGGFGTLLLVSGSTSHILGCYVRR